MTIENKSMLKTLSVVLGTILILSFIPVIFAEIPGGADLEEERTERANITELYPPESHDAFAGNVTELNLYGYSTTRTWQGYFGNVSGTIQLADVEGNVMYNWTQANPRGQVYASTNDTIQWMNIQCFNLTAEGTFTDETPNTPGGFGQTSQNGMNYLQLHEMFNIPEYAVDGVNDTFIHFNHDVFFTVSLEFGNDTEESSICPTARLYDDSADGVFQNVLLYEPETMSVIFTAILEVERIGFDGNAYDFQMIVLDDGRGTNIDTTTYYFYLDIE